MELVEDIERNDVCGIVVWKMDCRLVKFGGLFEGDPRKTDFERLD